MKFALSVLVFVCVACCLSSHAFVTLSDNHGFRTSLTLVQLQRNPYMSIDDDGVEFDPWEGRRQGNPWQQQQNQEQQQYSHYQNQAFDYNKPLSAYMSVSDDNDVDDDDDVDIDMDRFLSDGPPAFMFARPDAMFDGFDNIPHPSSLAASASESPLSWGSSTGGVPGPPPMGMFLKEKQAARMEEQQQDIMKNTNPFPDPKFNGFVQALSERRTFVDDDDNNFARRPGPPPMGLLFAEENTLHMSNNHHAPFPDNEFNGVPPSPNNQYHHPEEFPHNVPTLHGPPPMGMFAKEQTWDIFNTQATAAEHHSTQFDEAPSQRYYSGPPMGVFWQEHGGEESSGLNFDALSP